MNDAKPKTVFDERDDLRRENESLKRELDAAIQECHNAREQLTATEEALAQMQRESGKLRRKYETQKYRATVFADTTWEAKYEAARKVVDAAVAADIAGSARVKIGGLLGGGHAQLDAVRLLFDGQLQAMAALADAITEYRALTEPPALSPSQQAAFDRGIAGAEKVGEAWERN